MDFETWWKRNKENVFDSISIKGGCKMAYEAAQTNNNRDAIVALYARWSVSVARNFDHTQVDEFIDWVQQQQV